MYINVTCCASIFACQKWTPLFTKWSLAMSSHWVFPLSETNQTGNAKVTVISCWREPSHLPSCQSKNESLFLQQTQLHPGKLTLNPKMEVWKMIFLFNWVIFKCHVNFQGCNMSQETCLFSDVLNWLKLGESSNSKLPSLKLTTRT